MRDIMTYKDLLGKHIDELGKVLIAFETQSPAAIRMLADEKKALSLKYDIDDPVGHDLYTPACYNALAVIRSAIEQDKPNPQLASYVKDARDELIAIYEYMSEEI